MKATFITEENADMFIPSIPKRILDHATLLIGAIADDQTACGFMAIEEPPYRLQTDKIMDLLYLYVAPEYRNMGAATEMFTLLIKYSFANEFIGIQTRYPRTVKLLHLFRFLTNVGFEQEEELDDIGLYRIPVNTFLESMPQKITAPGTRLVFLSDLEQTDWIRFQEFMKNQIAQNDPEAIDVLPISDYIASLSCIGYENDEPVCCFLLTDEGDNDWRLDGLYIKEKKLRILGYMLSEVCARMEETLSQDPHIYIVESGKTETHMISDQMRQNGEKTNLLYQLMLF